MSDQRKLVENRLRQAWPDAGTSQQEKLVTFLLAAYDRYHEESLGDNHFSSEFLSESPLTFQQRLSELLMAEWLWRHGFNLSSSPKGHGPDFKVEKGGQSAWIELVSPEPKGLALEDVTVPAPGELRKARSVPHSARALCWTSSLRAKRQQLERHVAANIVMPGDIYVIAVNARMLVSPYFGDISGISRLPMPVELGFGVGPTAIEIDPITTKAVGSHVIYRADIPNRNGSPVDTHVFLDPAYVSVSAVLGVCFHDFAAFGRSYPSAVAHNPKAVTQLPQLWLPCDEHWMGIDYRDHWKLTRIG